MCLAIQQAKEELADAVGLDGEWLSMSVCVHVYACTLFVSCKLFMEPMQ